MIVILMGTFENLIFPIFVPTREPPKIIYRGSLIIYQH